MSTEQIRIWFELNQGGVEQYKQLREAGWTNKQIEDRIIHADFSDEVVEEDRSPASGLGSEPEKSDQMSDSAWEECPDFIKRFDPVALEEVTKMGGGYSFHVAADELPSRLKRNLAMDMECEDVNLDGAVLDGHRLWVIPFRERDVFLFVYPASEGVGISFVTADGKLMEGHSVSVPLDWMGMDNRGRQSQWLPDVAESLANVFGKGDVDELKYFLRLEIESIPDILNGYGDDAVEFFSHPDTSDLVADTVAVKGIYSPEEEKVEYRITMRAPKSLGIPGATGTMTLNGQQWAQKSGDAVNSAYMNIFGADLNLSDEMVALLYLEWDAMREMHTSADMARENLVDGFLSTVNGLSVTDAEAVVSWDSESPSGILFEEDGEDYIAVGSRWVRSILGDEARELSRPMDEVLRDEGLVSYVGRADGVLRKKLDAAEGVTNERSTVFVVPVGKTAQDADKIRSVDDGTADLTVGV
jgi:hypothetical protein